MNKLCNPIEPFSSSHSVQVVAAVVDRLPVPLVESNIRTSENALQDNAHSADSEGISLLLLDQAEIQGKAAGPHQLRSAGVEEPVLALSIQTADSSKPEGTVHSPPHEFGLRLANTTFTNGREHTLFGEIWACNEQYIPQQQSLELKGSLDLVKCLVRFVIGSVHSSFEFPLYPVSQRRQVVSCMGNILRQLAKSTDGQASGAIPASLELEGTLPRYISEHDIDDQRVSVWALLEKSDHGVSAESDIQARVKESLQAGGKLLRIMSGGGGWGKKQGLLSLDPETEFLDSADLRTLLTLPELIYTAHRGRAADSSHPFEEELAINELSSLSHIVEPGDYIQFFVSVEPEPVEEAYSKLPANDQGGNVSFCFGVLSDKEDEMLYGNEEVYQKDVPITLPHYFGALSEKAITYSQPVIEIGSSDTPVPSATKLDLPGCRVELVLQK